MKMLETPCFIIKEAEFQKNIREMQAALTEFFPCHILSYSVKTNSLPYLLEQVKEMGGYAETVSADEYALAREIGFPGIIYNGIAKKKESFLEALQRGDYVNIDHREELEWLKEIMPQPQFRLGIRVNVHFPDSMEEDLSRFGFSYENGELSEIIKQVKELGFSVAGLHLHRNSKARDCEVYRYLCKQATKIQKEQGLSLQYLDLGGGFYGRKEGKPTYREYMQAIYEELRVDWNLSELTVIVEPGNAVIASPVSYLCKLRDYRTVGDIIFYLCDGTRNDIDPLFQKKSYSYQVEDGNSEEGRNARLPKREEMLSKKKYLVGSTCMEKDIIMECFEPLKIGDYVRFLDVGAYTMTLSPNFISLLAPVYLERAGEYTLVREKWEVAEWIQKNKRKGL